MSWPFDSPDNYPTDAATALADLRAYFEGAGMRVDTRAKARGLHNVRVIEESLKERDETIAVLRSGPKWGTTE